MDEARVEELAEALRVEVFEMMDAEEDFDGEEAGRIAQATKEAFVRAVRKECGDAD